MLDRILTYLNPPKQTDDPCIRLDSVEFENHSATLKLLVNNHDLSEKWTTWTIRVTELCDYRIAERCGGLVVLNADHVLVRQHVEPRQDLYFYGVPSSPLEVLARIWTTHRDIAGDWISFERYFNQQMKLEQLLASGSGMLADGPMFLIQAYANVLQESGLTANTLKPRPPKHWNGESWIENKSSLFGLVIGDSYFVAENYEEELLSE